MLSRPDPLPFYRGCGYARLRSIKTDSPKIYTQGHAHIITRRPEILLRRTECTESELVFVEKRRIRRSVWAMTEADSSLKGLQEAALRHVEEVVSEGDLQIELQTRIVAI